MTPERARYWLESWQHTSSDPEALEVLLDAFLEMLMEIAKGK